MSHENGSEVVAGQHQREVVDERGWSLGEGSSIRVNRGQSHLLAKSGKY